MMTLGHTGSPVKLPHVLGSSHAHPWTHLRCTHGCQRTSVGRRAGMTQLEAESASKPDPLETEPGGPRQGVQRPRWTVLADAGWVSSGRRWWVSPQCRVTVGGLQAPLRTGEPLSQRLHGVPKHDVLGPYSSPVLRSARHLLQPAHRPLSNTAFITRQIAVPAPSTRVHPPGKSSAHDRPRDAVRARLERFYGEVTTTFGLRLWQLLKNVDEEP